MAITNALGLELPQEDDNLENGLIDTKMPIICMLSVWDRKKA